MIKKSGWITGIFVLALFCMTGTAAALEDTTGSNGTVIAGDIGPYNGAIGPGNPLYGLKIAFEDLDESFTTNESERFNKQMTTAQLRLSEAYRELQINNSADADRALDLYGQKTNITRLRLQAYADSNTTGLLHAQVMAAKHQLVLAGLLESHPNNTGLMRAYNNSLSLEEKFEEKTQTRFERVMQKNNATIMKAVRLEIRDQQSIRNAGQNQSIQEQETQQIRQGTDNGNNNGKGQGRMTEVSTSPGEQAAGTTTTLAPSLDTDDTGKGKSGTDNSTSNGNGNDNKDNGGSSRGSGAGNGKNR